jgi:hypothetical protein
MHRVQSAKAPPAFSCVPTPTISFQLSPPLKLRLESSLETGCIHLHYMTLDQKQLVQKTWEKVLPISNTSPVIRFEIITHE